LSTNLLNMQAGLSHAAHAHQAALCQGVFYNVLVKQCHWACLNTSTIPGSPCNTILRAHVRCMPLCFHVASVFV
jgi:hypothetical protein